MLRCSLSYAKIYEFAETAIASFQHSVKKFVYRGIRVNSNSVSPSPYIYNDFSFFTVTLSPRA